MVLKDERNAQINEWGLLFVVNLKTWRETFTVNLRADLIIHKLANDKKPFNVNKMS